MNDAANDAALLRVIRRLNPGARLLRSWPLTGGLSAQMTALEIALGEGPTSKLILRCHSAVTRVRNPQITAGEYRLLGMLHKAGLPVPLPLYLDTSEEILPAPYLILDYVVGTPVFDAAAVPDLVARFAAALARIHSVDLDRYDLGFLPRQSSGLGPRPDMLDDSLDEGHILEAMTHCRPLLQRNTPVLLHGDLWPGNVLWHNGHLAAIIDWEDARIGDPLVDLAKSRLELLWAFGWEARDHFTGHYATLMPDVDMSDLPYWDLAAALGPAGNLSTWGLPAEKEQRFRHLHHDFVTQAIRNLSSTSDPAAVLPPTTDPNNRLPV